MNCEPFEVNLEPLHQIEEVPGRPDGPGRRWWSGSNDPAWSCAWPSAIGSVIPGGWYFVQFELQVHKGRIKNPRLYPDYRQGVFLEVNAQALDISASTGESRKAEPGRMLVRFVEDVSALRFDPSVMPCDFTIDAPRLQRIGRREAFRHLFEDAWTAAPSMFARVRLVGSMLLDVFTGGPPRMGNGLFQRYTQRREDRTLLDDYTVWLDFFDSPADDLRMEQARRELDAIEARPLVSVVVPVYNTPEKWLRRCLDSVIEQVYPAWELCIADDASTQPHVASVLAEYAERDPRIKVVTCAKNGHISAASNAALELAQGQYVALLDHDDELHPLALLECIKAFGANPEWRMLFTDEDKIDESGVRSDPYFKSDWNPDLFLSQNCVCHLTVYERALVEQAGRFAIGMEGAQDWDLTLRVAERLQPHQIGHVPKVLYHWRMIEGSTALAPGEKSYAHVAGMRAIQSHLDRLGAGAEIQEMPGYSGYYRIRHALPSPPPLVSLLIPTRDRVDLLEMCVDSILEKTDYPNYEVLILDNGSIEPKTLEYFARVEKDARVRVLRYDQPFNYSAINNFGAGHARGEILGLLNNDVEVITSDWLTEMASHAWRPDIGVVGAMLYYPNDTIQHAGVFLGFGGVAGHAYVGRARGFPGDKHRAGLAQTLSAVTAACALMRAEVFHEVGGLDEGLQVAFNDVDLCLRVRARGYRNLWTPFAELYHHESATRGYEDTPEKAARFRREETFMQNRWGEALLRDPYYNPNLSITSTPFSLAYPPRY